MDDLPADRRYVVEDGEIKNRQRTASSLPAVMIFNIHFIVSCILRAKALRRPHIVWNLPASPHRKLCLFLLSPYGDPYFTRKMTESITKTAERAIKKNGSSYSSNQKYALTFLAGGFISTIYEWLRRDDCSAEEIADVLLKLITLMQG